MNAALLSERVSIGKPQCGSMTPQQFDQFQAIAGRQSHPALLNIVRAGARRSGDHDARGKLVATDVKAARDLARETFGLKRVKAAAD